MVVLLTYLEQKMIERQMMIMRRRREPNEYQYPQEGF
jgi:hypothetical protein